MSKFYDLMDAKTDSSNINIFAPPMTDTEVVDILQNYLCEDYITPNPVGRAQYNTEWVFQVLFKYSKRFKKEHKHRLKQFR